MQFAVGLKLNGKFDRVIVGAEDALVAAVKSRPSVRKPSSCTSAHKILE
jgi:hypothetical protein